MKQKKSKNNDFREASPSKQFESNESLISSEATNPLTLRIKFPKSSSREKCHPSPPHSHSNVTALNTFDSDNIPLNLETSRPVDQEMSDIHEPKLENRNNDVNLPYTEKNNYPPEKNYNPRKRPLSQLNKIQDTKNDNEENNIHRYPKNIGIDNESSNSQTPISNITSKQNETNNIVDSYKPTSFAHIEEYNIPPIQDLSIHKVEKTETKRKKMKTPPPLIPPLSS